MPRQRFIKNRANGARAGLGQMLRREKSGFARFESTARNGRNNRFADEGKGLPDFSAEGA
jgi:hypothetical protein